jgi:hypothetical protein
VAAAQDTPAAPPPGGNPTSVNTREPFIESKKFKVQSSNQSEK